jgi:hypothetical protein
MTLLTVCQAVARDAGFDVPASIVANTDDTAVQLLALATKAGEILARKPWQNLQNEYTFTTVIGQAEYDLPPGYRAFIDDTAWDRTNYWQLRGSLSPQEWQARKSGVISQSPRSRFRVKGNKIVIDPTPTAELDFVIEYLDSRWVNKQGGEDRETTFTNDTDTVRFDEFLLQLELLWRFLGRKGLAYLEEKQESDVQIAIAMARDTPSVPMNLAGSSEPWPPLPTVPVTGFGP